MSIKHGVSIELNLDKPEIPLSVHYGNLAGDIESMCSERLIAIPDELKDFVKKNSSDAAFEWQNKVLVAGEDMDIALLKQWVETIPGHFFRAELRAIYKRRTANDTEKQT